ncbi:MAG: hypothetical protein M3Z21_01045, partial [Pseudomonadota bacterium]|nr:hypothetical protein [Pseudomonadota bacterium]
MITVIESLNDNPLTKTHTLDPKGQLVSQRALHHAQYLAATAPVHTIHEFRDLLAILRQERALILGTTAQEGPFILASKREFARLTGQSPEISSFAGAVHRTAEGRTVITREKANFTASPIMVFDVDAKDEAPEHCRIQSPEQLLAILGSLWPALGAVTRVQTYSASAGLIGPDGRRLKDGTALHVYLQVSDPGRIAALARTLEIKLWAHGYGYFIASQDGKRLPRTIIDLAVYAQPNRIVFEAPPVLRDGIRQERPAPQLVQGEVDILDLSVLPELTEEEICTYEALTGQTAKRAGSGSGTRRLGQTLTWDTPIRLHSGQVLTVKEFKDSSLAKVSCHCPVHDDRSPSAFIAKTHAGQPFVYCSSCAGSYHVEVSLAVDAASRHRV